MSDIRLCNPAFESVVRAVRPIIFNTGYEDFPYATHGGTAFVISYKGRPESNFRTMSPQTSSAGPLTR
jgi:hypothetical protein